MVKLPSTNQITGIKSKLTSKSIYVKLFDRGIVKNYILSEIDGLFRNCEKYFIYPLNFT